MKYFSRILTLLLIFSVIIGASFAQDDATITENVQNFADADEAEFTVLLELLEASDLSSDLSDEDAEFTVFAPTDAAFEALLSDNELDIEALLEDIDGLRDILLYHVVDGIAESGDLEDGQKLETLQEISITIGIDGETVTLNDIATIVTADVQTSNGIIHVIDAVLLPPVPTERESEACVVSTDIASGASVHVGPGNNRTSVTFLEVDTDYEVLGQNEDSEGVIWFQLDKDEAAPGRSINEAWVSSDEVDATGGCDSVGETSAPPIIPIVNQQAPTPAPEPANDTAETTTDETQSTDAPVDTADTNTIPANGTYTVGLAQTTNASCEGGSNVPIPSNQFWTNTVFSTSIRTTATSMSFGGDILTYTGSVYNGQALFDGEYYTTTVYPSNSGFFTGTIIVSFTIDGTNCSGTVNFSASRQ
ncbi:MAG: hypothetical protein Phog2KO_00270 [Phototrophicaceae bacterium]